jgi:hypothetical protein
MPRRGKRTESRVLTLGISFQCGLPCKGRRFGSRQPSLVSESVRFRRCKVAQLLEF